MRDAAADSLRALVEVVDRLRAPGGCPWDRAQTHSSLRPYLLEETYELLEAIESGDETTLREELGDVLLQVLMHSAIAAEPEGGFDIGDVADTTRAKMVHRHPHVFGDVDVAGAADVVVNWERLKRAEKRSRISLLDGVPTSLPALALAQGVQRRPARLGFDETPTADAAAGSVTAALERLLALPRDAVPAARGEDWTVTEGEVRRGSAAAVTETSGSTGGGEGVTPAEASLERAVGELLFAAVALARRLRVNPEDALRRRAQEFAERFRAVEAAARASGLDLHDADEQVRARLWRQVRPDAG